MKKKIVSGIMLTLLLKGMLTLAFNIQPVRAEPRTIIVPDDYEKIQWAIGNASSGDTIRVRAGTYYEHISISKDNLTIFGENCDNTVIDGNGTGTILYVTASNLNLTGFTIENSGYSSDILYDPFCGVRLHWGFNNLINGNILLNNQFGIQVFCGSSHTITGNVLANNTYGIYMVYSANTRFRNNNMSRNIYNFGVWGYSKPEFTHDIDTSNLIDENPIYYLVNQNNIIVDPHKFSSLGYLAIINSVNVTVKNYNLRNNYQGVLFAFVAHSTIKNINVSNNVVGICLISSADNTVNHVFTSDNGDGIYVLGDGNRLIDNTMNSNNWGVYIWASRNNIITGNAISNNSAGICLGRDVQSSGVHHNNFVNNTVQAYVRDIHSINVWDDGYPSGGNYWSDYSDVDVKSGPNQDQLGSDGIGDTPYVIDENNQDNYPLMNPWTPTPLVITANIDINPDTLNLKSKGEWITTYIELPEGYNISDIDVSTILLEGSISAEWSDVQDNVLMVKFNRTAVRECIIDVLGVKYGNVTLTITGNLFDGTPFEGSDVIMVRLLGDVDHRMDAHACECCKSIVF